MVPMIAAGFTVAEPGVVLPDQAPPLDVLGGPAETGADADRGAEWERAPALGAEGGSALVFSRALWPALALALEEGAAVVAVEDVDVLG